MARKVNLSVLKRQRQQQKAYTKNKHYKSLLKTAVRGVLETKKRDEAEPLYRKAVSIIDSLKAKRIIHRNTAARRKSRIARHFNSLG